MLHRFIDSKLMGKGEKKTRLTHIIFSAYVHYYSVAHCYFHIAVNIERKLQQNHGLLQLHIAEEILPSARHSCAFTPSALNLYSSPFGRNGSVDTGSVSACRKFSIIASAENVLNCEESILCDFHNGCMLL